jgi:hypothetical protein
MILLLTSLAERCQLGGELVNTLVQMYQVFTFLVMLTKRLFEETEYENMLSVGLKFGAHNVLEFVDRKRLFYLLHQRILELFQYDLLLLNEKTEGSPDMGVDKVHSLYNGAAAQFLARNLGFFEVSSL